MTTFAYEAWDLDAKQRVSGEVEAVDRAELERVLGDRFVVTIVTERSERVVAGLAQWWRTRPAPPAERALVFGQLASLVRAGVTVNRALQVVSRQHTDTRAGRALVEVERFVIQGGSVSAAFWSQAHVFGDVAPAIVEAGERAGKIEGAFERLAELSRRRAEARREVRSALAYPIAVVCIFIVAMGVIVFGVAPKFQGIYASFGAQLPGATLVFLHCAHWITDHAYLLPIIFVGLVLGWRTAKRHDGFADGVDAVKLGFPYLSALWRLDALSNIADVLASLSAVGEGLPRAVELAARACGNRIYAKALLRARDVLVEGPDFREALERAGRFPDDMLAVIGVAEMAGDLSRQLAAYEEMVTSELYALRRTLRSTLEPLMAMLLAVAIGTCVILLYLPVFDIAKIIH